MVRNVFERGGAPVGVQEAKPLPGGSGGCVPRISRNKFDWGNIIHFSQLSRGRKERK